jgi:hypothetical protein
MFALQFAGLTRQLSRISLRNNNVCNNKQLQQVLFAAPFTFIPPMITSAAATMNNNQERSFATKRKKKKESKGKPKKKKSTRPKSRVELEALAAARTKEAPMPSLQHVAWTEFQKDIRVEGFETGQILKPQVASKRNRSIRKQRKLMMKEIEDRARERRRVTVVSGGRFPPERYSEEETSRLLELAYASIPPRAGKRGTLRLKRQKRRWFLVRKIHAKYKYHMAKYQVRKMLDRSRRAREARIVRETAPDVRQRDREYQFAMYKRWAEHMASDQGCDDGSGGEAQKEVVEGELMP